MVVTPGAVRVWTVQVSELILPRERARLAAWYVEYQAQQMRELIARSDVGKRLGSWQEYFDPDSGYRFFVQKDTEFATWDVPEEVEQLEQKQLCVH